MKILLSLYFKIKLYWINKIGVKLVIELILFVYKVFNVCISEMKYVF